MSICKMSLGPRSHSRQLKNSGLRKAFIDTFGLDAGLTVTDPFIDVFGNTWVQALLSGFLYHLRKIHLRFLFRYDSCVIFELSY